MRTLANKNMREWHVKLPHAEFASKRTPSFTTGHFPYEANYGISPLTPLELILFLIESRVSIEVDERGKEMKKLHQQIRAKIKKGE